MTLDKRSVCRKRVEGKEARLANLAVMEPAQDALKDPTLVWHFPISAVGLARTVVARHNRAYWLFTWRTA